MEPTRAAAVAVVTVVRVEVGERGLVPSVECSEVEPCDERVVVCWMELSSGMLNTVFEVCVEGTGEDWRGVEVITNCVGETGRTEQVGLVGRAEFAGEGGRGVTVGASAAGRVGVRGETGREERNEPEVRSEEREGLEMVSSTASSRADMASSSAESIAMLIEEADDCLRM